jgi:hypothetical protein
MFYTGSPVSEKTSSRQLDKQTYAEVYLIGGGCLAKTPWLRKPRRIATRSIHTNPVTLAIL